MSAVGCFGRFTFSHLAFHIPTLAGSCLCLFCVVVCLVALFLCFWFLFCKCLGIPNSPRSLDLDDRQGLIARSAMQQKKKKALRTDPALAAIGSMDGLAGDQICQWNSVAPDSILPPTHLSIFVPPPLGAFVLANHQNHEDFKSTPASATQSSPIFSVQQNIQFPLPQVFSNQDELLSLARLSAAEGYLSEEVIPFLGHSNQESALGASLSLATPVKRSRCPPFLFHSCVSTGSSKRRSPRWRYQGRRPAYLC